MRSTVRQAGLILVLGYFLIIILSLYFWVKWHALIVLGDYIWALAPSGFQKGEDIPNWFGPFVVIVISVFVLPLVFILSLLINFAKVHYKLDRMTFGVIQHVDRYIRSYYLNKFQCPRSQVCMLTTYLQSLDHYNDFRTTVFYHFANMDMIGTHNQAEKRRQVFDSWGKYYLLNQAFLMIILIWFWFVILFILKGPLWLAILLICLLLPLSFIWGKIGNRHKQDAETHARQQIDAFFLHAESQVVQQVASLITDCYEHSCQVRPAHLIRP